VSEFLFVQVEHEGDGATVWLNRPEKRNILSRRMMEELTTALAEIGEGDARGVVLAARGPVFSAGHDFAEMASQDLVTVRELFAICTRLMVTVQSIPQPVVARVQGLATGAGCQLVASADLAVAAEDASFATPGGKGGLFCTTPLVAVARLVGPRRALEMGMTGDAIDARTALAWGLVNEVVASGNLEEAAAELLRRATRGSAESKALGKRAFYDQISLGQPEAYELAREAMSCAALTPDAQEGIAAFLEKRPPRWPSEVSTTP
jgi:enoyl-CoA hydratase/carnithine racemase